MCAIMLFAWCFNHSKQKGLARLTMKIAIIGCPGSGKSTVAKQLHEKLNIPLYHLDQYYWLPGWKRPDKNAFQKVHHALCDQPEWLIEGMAMRNLAYRIAKADVVIFLDVPLWVCLYRIFRRACTGFGTIRDTSAPGCPERFPDREFLSYVWNFNSRHRPVIEQLLHQYKDQKKIYVIKNSNEIENFIFDIPAK